MQTFQMNNASVVAPEIAIVDVNAMSALGMAEVIHDIMPSAVVRTFNSFVELTDDTPDSYYHYFVSSQIFIDHSSFFIERKRKLIVMTSGLQLPLQLTGLHTLNVCQKQAKVIEDLTALFRNAHRSHHAAARAQQSMSPVTELLSPREIEVLALVVKGFINKEIAAQLSISLPTVVSHRQNITEKLGIKSVSGLTIFAVANGLVEASAI